MDEGKRSDRTARKAHAEAKRLIKRQINGKSVDLAAAVMSGTAAAIIEVFWEFGPSGGADALRQIWKDLGENYIKQIEDGSVFARKMDS